MVRRLGCRRPAPGVRGRVADELSGYERRVEFDVFPDWDLGPERAFDTVDLEGYLDEEVQLAFAERREEHADEVWGEREWDFFRWGADVGFFLALELLGVSEHEAAERVLAERKTGEAPRTDGTEAG